MNETDTGFRIFVLGAGFSHAAGLPLASELFPKVRLSIMRHHGSNTKFERDLSRYIKYRETVFQIDQSANIDLEKFMSYLDMEHYLRLRGSDTWSSEGNVSQLMIRKAIGRVIHNATPPVNQLPEVYYQFAERLSLSDLVITFNYDLLLESALEHVGKPYRLFPDRFSKVDPKWGAVETDDVEEVIVLKLHGSLDWFDDRQFLELQKYSSERGLNGPSIHSIFDEPKRYSAELLVQGPRLQDDSLLHIHRIHDVESFYSQDNSIVAPFILSPSHVKFVYAEPLQNLWHGIGKMGGFERGFSVIGFSLPEHDEYIRIGLYQMLSNYQRSGWDEKFYGSLKDNVKFVDCQHSDGEIEKYKQCYSFADPEKTEYMFDGFCDRAIKFLFERSREV